MQPEQRLATAPNVAELPALAWDALLDRPGTEHLVYLYTSEAALARVVATFCGAGLARGEAAIVIATPAHADRFMDGLVAAGVDVPDLLARRRFVAVDAQACLDRFMVDGRPDRAAFRGVIGDVLARVRATAPAGVRLYGEMVDLLWARDLAAATALEALWNEVLAEDPAALLCAYRIDNFDRHAHRTVLPAVMRCHSHVMPVDDPARLEQAVERAYAEVFGPQGEPEALRRLIVARREPGPVMPPAQAALVGLRHLESRTADAVLASAREHYRRRPTDPLDASAA
jgi:hypothetical protein